MKMPATPEARRKRLPLLRHSAPAHSTFGRQADCPQAGARAKYFWKIACNPYYAGRLL